MIYHLYSQRCFPLNLGDLTITVIPARGMELGDNTVYDIIQIIQVVQFAKDIGHYMPEATSSEGRC